MATRLWHGWLLLLALALASLGLAAAHGAWLAIAAQGAATPAIVPPAGYEADDHFPGAALLYAQSAPPPAARGATGTIALPPLPVPAAVAAALATDAGIVPARPFTFGRAGAADRARALQCLADAVYYEAAGEPDAGQRAVAQVVLNRVRHPAFPATVCGVVFQGSQAAGCQFSFACDGAMARPPSPRGWAHAAQVAAAALAGHVHAPVGLATHYHSYAVTPAWNRSLVMTDAEGAHFFHRWKGYWGTAAAFRQVYAGGEPLPGPQVRPVAPLSPVPVSVVIQPRYAEASLSAPVAPVSPEADRLPPAATVLPKWQDSGKPL